MYELSVLVRITAYLAENQINEALEVDVKQKMAFEASLFETNKVMEIGENPVSKLVKIDHSTIAEEHEDKSETKRLICI